MPDKGWQRRFDEPIPLSKGKKYAFVPAPSTMPSRWQGETKVNIGEVEQAARIVAIGAGIIFGALAISSVSWVWFRRQIFAYGGSVLSVTGIVLIGLSIYKTVDVTAAPSGIGIKLAEVEKLLKEQGETQQATQRKLAQIPSEFGTKIAEVDKAVKEQGAAQLAQFRKLEGGGSMIQRASSTSSTDDVLDNYWIFPKGTAGAMTSTSSKGSTWDYMKPDGSSIFFYLPDQTPNTFLVFRNRLQPRKQNRARLNYQVC